MAANTGGSDSTGRKNYYNISYGMLCTNAKTAPEGYEEISLADIKSRRTKNENVDLRKKYYDTKNGKEYPLRVFYTDIDGYIESVVKDKYEKGTSLKVTLHDEDGDESIIQADFFGKVSADFLNRLANVDPEKSLNFRPYSIPSTFEIDDRSINYYNAGVSIKDEGTKIERGFNKDNGLPPTEQVQDNQGEMVTSRVKQVNFLWEKVEAKFADLNAAAPKQEESEQKEPAPTSEKTTEKEAAKPKQEVNKNDLPF